LATGGWQLAAGCYTGNQRLATGGWLFDLHRQLATGYWRLAVRFTQAAGYWLLAAGCSITKFVLQFNILNLIL
jgi:hypothetical protein